MKNTMKKPVYIPVEKLHPFEGHPFKVKDDAEMNTLIESIQTQGILSPLIVRPIDKTDEYVIVAECNEDLKSCKISWGRKIMREDMERVVCY